MSELCDCFIETTLRQVSNNRNADIRVKVRVCIARDKETEHFQGALAVRTRDLECCVVVRAAMVHIITCFHE